MSLHQKTFSHIKSQIAESYDDFFQFKQDTYPFSEGFVLNNVLSLSAINDSSINNYSCAFLTDKLKDSDIYSFDTKQIPIANIVGTIEFPTGFLYFDDTSRLGALPFTTYNNIFTPNYHSVNIKLSGEIVEVNNSHFEIVIIDSIYCKIRHCVDDKIFYLVYQPGVFSHFDFYFTTTPQTFCITENGVDNSTFYCLYDNDDGYLSLYKAVSGISSISHYGITALGDGLTLTSVATGGYVNSSSNLCRVSIVNTVEPKINTSWVSYNIDNIEDGHVNDTKSRFNIKDNHLLTFEYSNSPGVQRFRDLKLKNIFTDSNTASRGCVFDTVVPEIPSVNHREYTTITTGNDEETGYPNITLHYQMYTKDIYIPQGTTTLFQTGSSLYPYETLNINDTSFAVNGSIGGLTPLVSDHVTFGDKLTDVYNGGKYLTTWLSAGDINTKGVWVDRYYIPDITTKHQAFSSLPVYSPTFENDIDKLIRSNAEYTDIISKSPIFDKISDVAFRNNTWYEYHRLGNKDITAFTGNIDGLSIKDFDSSRTFNGINRFNEVRSVLELNGTQFSSIPSSTVNKFNSFTLKFDYDIDWSVNDFYQLIGNSYHNGFGIFKNKKITPFVYIIESNKLKVFNTDLQFLFDTTFNSPVKTAILTPYLGDIIVIDGNGGVYKISTIGVIRQYLQSNIPTGYISWTQDQNYAYFLYSGGSCIKLNLTTLDTSVHTITPFDSDETINAITEYNGVVYGIEGECVKYNSKFGFISGGNDIIRYNFKNTTKETFVTTNNGNIVVTIDDGGYIYTADGKTITKLTKNRQLVNSTNVESLSSTPIRVDTISEFNENGVLNVEILYVSQSTVDNSIIITKYTKDLEETMNVITSFSSSDPRDYILSNYNLFNHETRNDSIRISIALVSLYDRKDIINQFIDIPLQNLSKTGTFVIRCDTNQGNFTVYNNYQKLGNITFDPAKYRLDDLFYDDIFVGTTGMANNTPLMNVINQPNYYTVQDSTVSNLSLYNRPLMDYEIHALLLESHNIQDLVLTLPCGQRNNMEEIRRMFFFQPPISKSTDINVIIKNSTINSMELQNTIKDRVLIDIKKYLPGHVNINDITFTTYKND